MKRATGRWRRRRRSWSPACALAVALVGCAGDDSDDSAHADPEGPSSTAAPSTTAAPVELTGLDEAFGTAGVKASPLSASASDRFMAVAAGPRRQVLRRRLRGRGRRPGVRARPASRRTARSTPPSAPAAVATVNVAVGGKTAEIARGRGGPGRRQGRRSPDQSSTTPALPATTARTPTSPSPASTTRASSTPPSATQGVARIDLGTGKAVSDTTYVGDTSWGLGVLPDEQASWSSARPRTDGADRTDADYVLLALTAAGALDTSLRHRRGAHRRHQPVSGDSPRNLPGPARGQDRRHRLQP